MPLDDALLLRSARPAELRARINALGHLILTMDGRNIDAGKVVSHGGQTPVKSNESSAGGVQSVDFEEGPEGVRFTLRLTNGEHYTSPPLRHGNTPAAPREGRDGTGIYHGEVSDAGDLVLTLTNGQRVNVGRVKGKDGLVGCIGPVPRHEWDGTKLRFELERVDGKTTKWGPWVDLRGPPGRGGRRALGFVESRVRGGGGGGDGGDGVILRTTIIAASTDSDLITTDGTPSLNVLTTDQILVTRNGVVLDGHEHSIPTNDIVALDFSPTVGDEYEILVFRGFGTGSSSSTPVSPTTSSEITRLVQYSDAFVAGQIVYIEDDVAYPVTRAMDESVLNLLAGVKTAGSAGANERVVVSGILSAPSYSLTPGIVYLGDSGFPVSTDNAAAKYVPLGYASTTLAFFFSPQQRYFR